MNMNRNKPEESAFATWTVIGLMVAGIILMGFFALFAVGDRGQPTWDYRPVKDVPASSPYAIYGPLPYAQHVKGAKGE